jgi:hypothetical protein
LRLLGIVYLAAFTSLAVQVRGLIGHAGILPAAPYLADVAAIAGPERFWQIPTLAWISAGDTALVSLCIAGSAMAALLVAGVLPAIVVPALWLTYLSLVVVSRHFLAFQWDGLLLEAGFLAITLAPWTVRERWRDPSAPPRLAALMMRWLLFRLTVASGVVKLASGDPSWWSLNALLFHFETQPLPTPLAWYVHRLPGAVLHAFTLAVLAIEIAVPLLIFGPRRLRQVAFAALVALQLLIALTGNYAFFNLLTAGLCLFILDDSMIGATNEAPVKPVARPRQILAAIVALVTIPVSLLMFARSFGIEPRGTAIVQPLADLIRPFRSVNGYGLFAIMTTTRPEIVLEGTEDGATWLEYEFRHKPGDIHRRPSWVAPHQPRLDWQMWFAALSPEEEPWLDTLCSRLLGAEPDVLHLLARDPFQGRRPKQIRAIRYHYRFSSADEAKREGAWWVREREVTLSTLAPFVRRVPFWSTAER